MHKPVGMSLRCLGLNNAQTCGDVIVGMSLRCMDY